MMRLNRTETTWGIRYWLFQLVFLPTLVALVLNLVLPLWSDYTLNVICWGINFLAVCGIFHRFLWKSLEYSLKNIKKILLTALAGLGIYWAISIGLNVVLLILFPDFYNVNDASISESVQMNLPVMFVGTVLLVPLVEEVFYRGLTFGLLYHRSRWLAYGVSICLFGAIHVMGYVGEYEPLHLLLCFVQYIPAGVVMAGVYQRTGSIFTPVLIHMAVNTVSILSMR